jgi:hypothetical protein
LKLGLWKKTFVGYFKRVVQNCRGKVKKSTKEIALEGDFDKRIVAQLEV